MRGTARHFQVIFEHSPVGMLILDTEGRVLYGNNTVASLLGANEQDIRERRITEFFHPDEISRFDEHFRRLNTSEEDHFRQPCRFVRADGSYGHARIDVTHVTSREHSPFVFAIIEDITAERANQARLERAKESAERATRTKSAFLANMSHEIRTPLHTISGMIELLLETQLDEEQREYAQQVKFSAEVLLGLINDILDFSKIEAGKLSLETIEFDLITSVEEAVDMVSLEAHKKGLDVVVELDPRLPRKVIGDAVRLRQIIVNLFSNAVKFTSEGQIAFRVTEIPPQNGDGSGGTRTILFEVIDSGIGIPEDKLTRLFTAFSQVDSSTTRKYGGTGLGLSICRSLVHLMGGKIGVRSQYKRGSTFWYTVPFSSNDGDTVPPDDLNGLADGQRLLLVDDNAVARRATRSYLEWWGFAVDEAESGEQSLSMMKKRAADGEGYELALVDLSMHGMDGWQVASEVNADKNINATKLILMSPTGTMAGEAKMKLLRWFNAYANKPIKWNELREAVITALRSDLDLDEADDEQVGDLEPVEPEGEAAAEEVGVQHTVLIAEDHFVNQQLFRTILEKRGYTVLLANNGAEAVDMVERDRPDIVFMDVHMPEMNGYEATKRIRAAGSSVPIVAVTANALKGEAEKCLEIGMDDYLTKPFKSEDLSPLLDKYLVRATSRHEGNGKMPEGSEIYDMGTEDEPIFDYDEAVKAFMGKGDVVNKVVNGFIERVAPQLSSLEQLLEKGDMEEGRNQAHSIKGGAWNLSAVRLGNAAARMEEACRIEDGDAARSELTNLKNAFDEFTSYCQTELGLS